MIEVLVALSVTAVLLGAIGSLVAAAVRGTRSLEFSLAQTETARAIMGDIANQRQFQRGIFSGVRDGHGWQVDVQPFASPWPGQESTAWMPQAITVKIKSPGGKIIELKTIRLLHRGGQ